MVAKLVPEVDQVDVTDLFANLMAPNVLVAVVEVVVDYNRGMLSNTILAVVGPSTIVIAALVPEVNLAEDAKLLA